jgi:hypothetical protein
MQYRIESVTSVEMEGKFLPPQAFVFLKFLAIFLLVFAPLGALLYYFTEPVSFREWLNQWLINLMLIPIGIAIGLTYSARKYRLTIKNIDDVESLRIWIIDVLNKSGLKLKAFEDVVVFESVNPSNRFLNHWFRSEFVFVRITENRIDVTGHYRYVDIIELKLKLSLLTVSSLHQGTGMRSSS